MVFGKGRRRDSACCNRASLKSRERGGWNVDLYSCFPSAVELGAASVKTGMAPAAERIVYASTHERAAISQRRRASIC